MVARNKINRRNRSNFSEKIKSLCGIGSVRVDNIARDNNNVGRKSGYSVGQLRTEILVMQVGNLNNAEAVKLLWQTARRNREVA